MFTVGNQKHKNKGGKFIGTLKFLVFAAAAYGVYKAASEIMKTSVCEKFIVCGKCLLNKHHDDEEADTEEIDETDTQAGDKAEGEADDKKSDDGETVGA